MQSSSLVGHKGHQKKVAHFGFQTGERDNGLDAEAFEEIWAWGLAFALTVFDNQGQVDTPL